MDSLHITKLRSLYARGVITAPEFINGLVVELIKHEGPTDELTSYLTTLPDDVRQHLGDLLQQIQRADYQWRPFMLGPGGPVLHSATEDVTKLRRICLMLENVGVATPSVSG